MQVRVGGYELSFNDIEHETFSCKDNNGVTFIKDGYRYQVVDCLLGVRLIINSNTEYGFLKDMPFHKGTWEFLPAEVRVSTAPSTSG